MQRSVAILCAAVLLLSAGSLRAEPRPRYRLETRPPGAYQLRERFDAQQIALLEKLNRADARRLERLPQLVLPESWSSDELQYSPLPAVYPPAASVPKLLVVHLAGQVFGGYEHGTLVRWGPISSGRASARTPVGWFHLNWRSTGRSSTVDPSWFMRWYFNFDNLHGLALHEYELPGYPASHGCIRLLRRDAMWLYDWGDGWTLDSNGRLEAQGTPVMITAPYDYGSPPPWRSLDWLQRGIDLPHVTPASSLGRATD